MKKILVHIGMPKTGSTAIQTFFYENREELGKQGIGFYVSQTGERVRNRMANGSFINEIVMLGKDNIEWYEAEKEDFRRFISNYDTILLSEELMWLYSFDKTDYWKDAKAIIEELTGEDVVIRPIIYIRRQDEWAFSWWKESVRIAKPTDQYFREFFSYLERRGMLDYDRWIGELESVFGQENLMIRVFDKNRFPHNSIFQDYMQSIGIVKGNGFVIKDSIINPSITMKAAYAIIMINRGHIKYDMETVDEVENLREASRIFSRTFPEDRELYPIDLEGRMRWIDRFTESNRKVSERYFECKEMFSMEIKPYEMCCPNHEEDLQNAKSIVKLARALEHKQRLFL